MNWLYRTRLTKIEGYNRTCFEDKLSMILLISELVRTMTSLETEN